MESAAGVGWAAQAGSRIEAAWSWYRTPRMSHLSEQPAQLLFPSSLWLARQPRRSVQRSDLNIDHDCIRSREHNISVFVVPVRSQRKRKISIGHAYCGNPVIALRCWANRTGICNRLVCRCVCQDETVITRRQRAGASRQICHIRPIEVYLRVRGGGSTGSRRDESRTNILLRRVRWCGSNLSERSRERDPDSQAENSNRDFHGFSLGWVLDTQTCRPSAHGPNLRRRKELHERYFLGESHGAATSICPRAGLGLQFSLPISLSRTSR